MNDRFANQARNIVKNHNNAQTGSKKSRDVMSSSTLTRYAEKKAVVGQKRNARGAPAGGSAKGKAGGGAGKGNKQRINKGTLGAKKPFWCHHHGPNDSHNTPDCHSLKPKDGSAPKKNAKGGKPPHKKAKVTAAAEENAEE